MDIAMPLMDGFTALEKIKLISHDIEVIVITADENIEASDIKSYGDW